MSNIPNELKYTKSHEWIRNEGNDEWVVGITDHAQELLGDMVFVDLPEVGEEVHIGDDCGVVESVKAASDVYCPLDGEIIEINEELMDTPELVNSDPYGDGWLFRIKVSGDDNKELLDAEEYAAHVEEEEN